jgi:hypothetical protein
MDQGMGRASAVLIAAVGIKKYLSFEGGKRENSKERNGNKLSSQL